MGHLEEREKTSNNNNNNNNSVLMFLVREKYPAENSFRAL